MPDAPSTRLRTVTLALLAAGGMAIASCTLFEGDHVAGGSPRREDLRLGAVLLFVDGLDREILHELLADGRLPNIQRHLVEAGARVEAVSCLPTITFLNTASLLTGAWPNRHGVYGNFWFDRESLAWRDYRTPATFQLVNQDLAASTVYEHLAGLPTLNFQCHTRRGVTATYDNPIMSALDWMVANYESVDARVGREVALDRRLLGPPETRPVLATLYFPGVDEVAHLAGPRSARYAAAIENFDRQVGRVIESLDSQSLLSQTFVMLVTDHGQHDGPASKALPLARWLRENVGLRLIESLPPEPAARQAALSQAEAMLLLGNARHAVLHWAGPTGWETPAAPAQIRERLGLVEAGLEGPADGLLTQPAIGLVLLRDGADVEVWSAAGHGRIERRDGPDEPEYRWTRSAGRDPLGYFESGLEELGDGSWRGSREWLRATLHSDHPDFVPQISEYFRSPRAGDVLIFAAPDAWFTPAGQPGHGGPLPTEARTTLLVRGPGIMPGTQLFGVRLVDVTPTLIDLLGLSDRLAHATLDGRSFAARLREASEAGDEVP